MQAINSKVVLGVGTLFAAVGASLCCIVPIGVVLFGVGSAALGMQLMSIRPYLLGLTVVFLGTAFYQVYKPNRQECAPDESCAVPPGQRRQRTIVWVFAFVAIAVAALPYYVNWIILL